MGFVCVIILVALCIVSSNKQAKQSIEGKKKWDEDKEKYGFTFWTEGKDDK